MHDDDDDRPMTDREAAIWLARRQDQHTARQAQAGADPTRGVIESVVGLVILVGALASLLAIPITLYLMLTG